jgi:hypothetical protein
MNSYLVQMIILYYYNNLILKCVSNVAKTCYEIDIKHIWIKQVIS